MRPSNVDPITDACVIASPTRHQPARVQRRQPRGQPGAGRRAVEPARARRRPRSASSRPTPCHGAAIWTMLTPAISGFSGCDARAAARARRCGSARRRASSSRASDGSSAKPSAARVGDRVPHAAVGDVDPSVPSPSTSSGASRRSAKRGDVRQLDALAAPVAARRARPRRRRPAPRAGRPSRARAASTMPGLEQHGRDADRVRAGHGRILGRLHDDEAGVAVRAASPGRRGSRGTATLPRGSRRSSRRSESSRRSVCICSNTVRARRRQDAAAL